MEHQESMVVAVQALVDQIVEMLLILEMVEHMLVQAVVEL
jgi:hypothetical protein